MHPDSLDKDPGFLEIHDPEIDVEEIIFTIESRLKSRNISPEDIERISNIKFSPQDLTGIRDMDPAYTASLFEKGISVPKFTNPKLWFIRGPLKYFLTKFVEFYSLVDRKLSENRVRAFYQLLHEVLVLKKKQQFLSEKIEKLFKEYISTIPNQSPNPSYQPYPHYLPLTIASPYESGVPPESDLLLDFVRDVQPVLIYYPDSLSFLEYCNLKNLQFKIHTPYHEDASLLRRKITDKLVSQEDIGDCQSILFHANARLFPAKFWEGLLRFWLNLKKELRFVIRYKDSDQIPLSPFSDNLPLKIQESYFITYLRELGFRNVHLHKIHLGDWRIVTFHIHTKNL